MKRLLTITTAALLIGCNTTTNYPTVEHDQMVGNTYKNSLYTIEIKSLDSLSWTLWTNRGSDVSYTLPYKYIGEELSFDVADTIAKPISGTSDYIFSYLSDSFKGSFRGEGMLVGDKIIHSYANYENNTYITGSGTSESKGVNIPLKKKK